MNKKTKLKIILLYSILVLLGIAFPFLNVIYFFVYFFIAIMIAVVAFILLLFALLDKKATTNAVLTIIALLVFVGSTWASESFTIFYKRNTGEEIIEKLEKFKTIHNEYPISLEQLELNNQPDNVRYFSNTKNYTIVVTISDINRQEYDSKTKQWNAFGWND